MRAKLRRAPRDAARDARGGKRVSGRSERSRRARRENRPGGWAHLRGLLVVRGGGELVRLQVGRVQGSESGPMDEILERRRADAVRSRGAARATIPADVDVNPATRDVRRSSGKTRPRAGRRRARGPRLGRCHSPCPTRVGGESRRRGVACRAKGRARTSGRKQLNPSSKSGCPPRRLFTRRTTSGVSDLRIEGSTARQRGAVIAPSYGGF